MILFKAISLCSQTQNYFAKCTLHFCPWALFDIHSLATFCTYSFSYSQTREVQQLHVKTSTRVIDRCWWPLLLLLLLLCCHRSACNRGLHSESYLNPRINHTIKFPFKKSKKGKNIRMITDYVTGKMRQYTPLTGLEMSNSVCTSWRLYFPSLGNYSLN